MAVDERAGGAEAEHVDTQQGYDRWAEIYDGEGNPLIALEEPVVTGLLGEVRGLEVVDLGCGTGRHAVRLAAAGARVTAVDFSEGMLARARTKAGAERVTWVRHDIGRPSPLADRCADRVICCLVLDHVHEVGALFREFVRLCRGDGAVVVSVMHPAMMLKGVQARFTDPATGREVRLASAPNLVSDYVMAAVGAGLRIEAMSEHTVDEELARRMPRAARYVGWPVLLAMRMSVA
ncbi:MAG: methyltransferase domain-containing protein [Phycisphaeraceae bacterium]|nr:methyltransferase domain-containing protein [Phycisphaeraceae bacterium]